MEKENLVKLTNGDDNFKTNHEKIIDTKIKKGILKGKVLLSKNESMPIINRTILISDNSQKHSINKIKSKYQNTNEIKNENKSVYNNYNYSNKKDNDRILLTSKNINKSESIIKRKSEKDKKTEVNRRVDNSALLKTNEKSFNKTNSLASLRNFTTSSENKNIHQSIYTYKAFNYISNRENKLLNSDNYVKKHKVSLKINPLTTKDKYELLNDKLNKTKKEFYDSTKNVSQSNLSIKNSHKNLNSFFKSTKSIGDLFKKENRINHRSILKNKDKQTIQSVKLDEDNELIDLINKDKEKCLLENENYDVIANNNSIVFCETDYKKPESSYLDTKNDDVFNFAGFRNSTNQRCYTPIDDLEFSNFKRNITSRISFEKNRENNSNKIKLTQRIDSNTHTKDNKNQRQLIKSANVNSLRGSVPKKSFHNYIMNTTASKNNKDSLLLSRSEDEFSSSSLREINRLEQIKINFESRIERITREIDNYKNKLKISFNSIKNETTIGNEIQINRIIKENIDNFKKSDYLKKEITDMRNQLIELSDQTKDYSEAIKKESIAINRMQREIIKYNKLISDTFKQRDAIKSANGMLKKHIELLRSRIEEKKTFRSENHK